MRSGVRLGIDAGKARIGVASSDLHGMLATPVETVPRDHSGTADLTRLVALVTEYQAVEVIVGLPLNLQGHHTPSTEDAIDLAERLATALTLGERDVTVRLVDERLSTVSAQSQLRQAGKKTKQSRAFIDQAAAVVILQQALDIERSTDAAPGRAVVPEPSGVKGADDARGEAAQQ